MSAFHPTAYEVQLAQDAAKVCEAHLFYAHGCKNAGNTHPVRTSQALARQCSAAAFALSARIAARSQA